MPKFELRPIIVSEHLASIRALLCAHWRESEPDVSEAEPDPQTDTYQALSDAGLTVAFGAFEGDEMVGYCVAFVSHHLHYGVLYAAHDALFVRKDRRNSPIGLRLINATRHECKARGAKFMVWTAKPDSQFSKILLRQQCVVEEIVYRERF